MEAAGDRHIRPDCRRCGGRVFFIIGGQELPSCSSGRMDGAPPVAAIVEPGCVGPFHARAVDCGRGNRPDNDRCGRHVHSVGRRSGGWSVCANLVGCGAQQPGRSEYRHVANARSGFAIARVLLAGWTAPYGSGRLSVALASRPGHRGLYCEQEERLPRCQR